MDLAGIFVYLGIVCVCVWGVRARVHGFQREFVGEYIGEIRGRKGRGKTI